MKDRCVVKNAKMSTSNQVRRRDRRKKSRLEKKSEKKPQKGGVLLESGIQRC